MGIVISSCSSLFLKKKSLFPLVILFLVSLFLFFQMAVLKDSKQVGLKTIYIKNHPIIVEIAQSQEAKTKGLSGREKLAPASGMLFIFPKAGYYPFWMKEMLFPLDFIWINSNEVVDLTENVPFPKVEYDQKFPTYTSNVPTDKVLEVKAGTIKSLNISIGDNVSF